MADLNHHNMEEKGEHDSDNNLSKSYSIETRSKAKVTSICLLQNQKGSLSKHCP